MSIVILASAKGSPGATTTALALASLWPRPLIIVEADPAGGDLAARLGMPEEPGLVGLAAALRRNPQRQSRDGEWIADHVQKTSTGIQVILAPAGSRQASSALNLLSDVIPPPLPDRSDLLVDIGRLADSKDAGDDVNNGRRIAGWTKGNSSDLFVWICRPDLAALAHLAAILHQHQSDNRKQVIVLRGAGPYPANEVAGTLGLPVLGQLPTDPEGTAALWMGGGRTWVRSALGRAAKSLVETIGTILNREGDEVAQLEDAVTAEAPELDRSLRPEAMQGHI